MLLEYSKAKNESLTCSYSNSFLHSSYNPENESLRFVENIKTDFIPKNIIIIEPALAYCNQFLRKKFPAAKIFAIRFIENINSIDKFEKEFFFSNEKNLKKELYNYFGEENILNTLFISWPASAKIFADKDTLVWKTIKDLLLECKSILATRQFFSKRWIKNQINFFSNIQKIKTIKKLNLPILICASGPSLKNCINIIKNNQNNFFIISCSSATKTLISNNIQPDLCISTDGGYWAKKHLKCLLENNNIPLAITAEANIYTKIFSKIDIIPLLYDDSLVDDIFYKMDIDFHYAKRNGTVSGTALELAFNLTSKDILLCGIDLESTSGFVHTQPNELEIDNSIYDSKIHNKETRIFAQGRNSVQLDIYRNWFINNSYKFNNRVFRISIDGSFKNNLDKIKDITWDKYLKNFITFNNKNTETFFTQTKTINVNKNIVKKLFEEKIQNENFIKEYYPADSIMIEREKNQNNSKYKNMLDNKINEIKEYLNKINGE